jgi:hypothetical protein
MCADAPCGALAYAACVIVCVVVSSWTGDEVERIRLDNSNARAAPVVILQSYRRGECLLTYWTRRKDSDGGFRQPI